LFVQSFGLKFVSHLAELRPFPLVSILLASTTLLAQVNLPGNQSGTPINTSTIQHGADSVNAMGLGLKIDIPLLTLQERGRTYTWSYVYNSPTYEIRFDPQPTQQNRAAGQWNVWGPGGGEHSIGPDNWVFANPYSWYIAFDTSSQVTCSDSQTYATMTNYRLVDPEGNVHPLSMAGLHYYIQKPSDGPCAGSGAVTTLTSPTLDGIGAYADLSIEYGDGSTGNAFWLKEGTKFTLQAPPPPTQDYIGTSEWGSSAPPRVISVEDSNGNLIGPDMMNRAGLVAGGAGSTKTYTYQDSSGLSQTITMNMITVN